jgi:hypothetical protein
VLTNSNAARARIADGTVGDTVGDTVGGTIGDTVGDT